MSWYYGTLGPHPSKSLRISWGSCLQMACWLGQVLGMRGVTSFRWKRQLDQQVNYVETFFRLKRSAYGRSYSGWWFQPILKHSQNGNLHQLGWKSRNNWNHHLVNQLNFIPKPPSSSFFSTNVPGLSISESLSGTATATLFFSETHQICVIDSCALKSYSVSQHSRNHNHHHDPPRPPPRPPTP